MAELDKVYGKDKNPARMNPQIEGTNEYATIPAGPRKGERITMGEWHFWEGAQKPILQK